MAVNDVTPNFGIARPHPDNRLQEDVLRLREGLSTIDQTLVSLQQAIQAQGQGAASELSQAVQALQQAIGQRAAMQHSHGVGQVDGLDALLASKLAIGQYGIGGAPQTVTDLNATPEVDGYFMGAGMANAPSGSLYVVHQTLHNGAWVQQMARDIYSDDRFFTRWKISGSWQPWRWVTPDFTAHLNSGANGSYLRHGGSYSVYTGTAFGVYLPSDPFVGWKCHLLNGWNHFGSGTFTLYRSNGAHVINGVADNVVFNFNVPRVTVEYAWPNTWVLG